MGHEAGSVLSSAQWLCVAFVLWFLSPVWMWPYGGRDAGDIPADRHKLEMSPLCSWCCSCCHSCRVVAAITPVFSLKNAILQAARVSLWEEKGKKQQ